MPTEHERRFLVNDVTRIPELDTDAGHELIVQGYLAGKNGAALRIRRRLLIHGTNERLLVEGAPELEYKGPRQHNQREEHRWGVPEHLAPKLIALSAGLVQKRRYPVVTRFGLWDLDVFLVHNAGLVIAELETEQPIANFVKPDWCGIDIGELRLFDNEQLATNPIKNWTHDQLAEFGLRYTGDEGAS